MENTSSALHKMEEKFFKHDRDMQVYEIKSSSGDGITETKVNFVFSCF